MQSWLDAAVPLAVAVLVVFGPGVLVGLAFRLRGLALWALAPALGSATLTLGALGLGLFGIGWRPLSAFLAVLAVAALVWVVRIGLRLPALARAGSARGLLVTGIAVGMILTAIRVGLYIGAPDAISQTNDGAFHLNALRYAVETGSASPLKLGGVIGSRSFYPSAWHVLASLVAQGSASSVEVAANILTLVLAAAVWPLGIAYLTRSVAGPIAATFAAALAASVAAFPLLLVQWGVLYPQLLATAVLPAALAVLADTGLRRVDAPGFGRRAAILSRPAALAAFAVAAILFSQPSVALAWALGGVAVLLWAIVSRWPASTWRARRALVAALLLATITTAVVWWLFSRSLSAGWPPTAGKAMAALEVVGNGFLGYPWAVFTSILMIAGIVVAVRTPSLRWIATLWAMLGLLYVVAASIGAEMIRSFLVGAWYEDPYRLAALVPVAALPLAGAGAAWAVSAFALAVSRSVTSSVAGRVAWSGLAVVGMLGAISLVVAPQIDRRDVFAGRIDANLYLGTADSYLSIDERAVLDRLDRTVPPDAVIIANPSTGAAFGYALSGRNVLPRTWSPPSNSAYGVLWTSLRDVDSDPAVCEALATFGADYVLDFGPGEEYPGRWIMPGFTGIEGQPGFELVDREGSASLWRIVAC